MSYLPTMKYPFVIQMQNEKKGKWSTMTAIRCDMTYYYAMDALEKVRARSPEHNWRILSLEIID